MFGTTGAHGQWADTIRSSKECEGALNLLLLLQGFIAVGSIATVVYKCYSGVTIYGGRLAVMHSEMIVDD